MEDNMKHYSIKIWGIVQGVGFRPFISKLANNLGIRGQVKNCGGLVKIDIIENEKIAYDFIEKIKKERPSQSEIVHIEISVKEILRKDFLQEHCHEKQEEIIFENYKKFTILESESGGDDVIMIPTDLPICESCISEIDDFNDLRYKHPFISCMVCGPRYTIIDRVPYDRKNTSMEAFEMCEKCFSEYTNIEDRRYHAQTISCNDCGPYLIYNGKREIHPIEELVDNDALNQAVKEIKSGNVIAVKGVGGYHFTVNPFSKESVLRLRRLKKRDEKPFAVMFETVEDIEKHCFVSEEEKELLKSNPRPIVLLKRKEENFLDVGLNEKDIDIDTKTELSLKEENIVEGVYRTSKYLGCFLPSTPLQILMLRECGPLIMTSGNLSGRPIIKDDNEILKVLNDEELLRGVLFNERDIRIRVDDSVARIINGKPQVIRRSKGYTPVPLYIPNIEVKRENMIFATGADLKSSFCMTKENFAYVSQFFGDLESEEIIEIYKENIERFRNLFRIKPKIVVVDSHPKYSSKNIGEDFGKRNEIEVLEVQHHKAHIASVIAEYGIDEDLIGVSFDGTGYGDDGKIWGGEFFCFNNMNPEKKIGLKKTIDYIEEERIGKPFEIERVGYFEYVKMSGGDSAMKNASKSLFAYLYHSGLLNEEQENISILEGLKGQTSLLKASLDNNINTVENSSVGRLFDGMAALLEIQYMNRYEGECGIVLENYAEKAIDKGISPLNIDFKIDKDLDGRYAVRLKEYFEKIIEYKKQNVSKECLSLTFHYSIANVVLNICKNIRIERKEMKNVALSGGVFQNKILMERTIELLEKNSFKVYYNINVPPNDNGIALGQAYLGMRHLEKEKI